MTEKPKRKTKRRKHRTKIILSIVLAVLSFCILGTISTFQSLGSWGVPKDCDGSYPISIVNIAGKVVTHDSNAGISNVNVKVSSVIFGDARAFCRVDYSPPVTTMTNEDGEFAVSYPRITSDSLDITIEKANCEGYSVTLFDHDTGFINDQKSGNNLIFELTC